MFKVTRPWQQLLHMMTAIFELLSSQFEASPFPYGSSELMRRFSV